MNKWKVIAIILFVLLLLESFILLWSYNLGNKIIEQENECSINICKDYDSYYVESNICYCYEDNEVKYYEVMG